MLVVLLSSQSCRSPLYVLVNALSLFLFKEGVHAGWSMLVSCTVITNTTAVLRGIPFLTVLSLFLGG